MKLNRKKLVDSYKKTRFGSETPKKYKRIRNIGILLAIIWYSLSEIPTDLPEKYLILSKYIGWISGIISFACQFATKKENT